MRERSDLISTTLHVPVARLACRLSAIAYLAVAPSGRLPGRHPNPAGSCAIPRCLLR